jgi:2-polyprenyl-6-methoxyphenol hydroxylase-like FAD-dependent oxidoreductase
MYDFDVVVVGGGPVGLMLARELGIARTETVVIERLAERSPHSKAFGLHARSLEVLDRRGLVDRFREGARSWANGHFAGLDTWVDFSVLDSSHAYALLVQQTRTEELLEAAALEVDVEIRRSHEVTAVVQDADGVTVDITGPEGPYQLRAKYVVGTDGGRSLVRKAAGIDFPGTGGRVTARLGDVILEDRENAPMGMERTGKGLIFCVPLEQGYHRLATFTFGEEKDPASELTLDELKQSMTEIWGTDYGMRDARWLSWFTDSARQADRYREGRLLIAGDAAHTHFPVGGQGLNLGLQDAFNLGWKLAAHIHGWAHPELLDSYDAERQQPARRVLENTRAQIALMNPDPDVTPLRGLFTSLMGLDQVNLYIAQMLTGVDVRYDLGGTHRLLGDFAADLAMETPDGERKLSDLTKRGNGLLLDLAERPEIAAAREQWAAKAGWDGRVKHVVATSKEEPDLAGLLIRPDGYVAWAADRSATPEQIKTGLAEALARWF